jgi:LysR family glycine cleavage system transcriptional activator
LSTELRRSPHFDPFTGKNCPVRRTSDEACCGFGMLAEVESLRGASAVPVRPPSLRAIAALEAAARHQSFTKAAEELNLTQSAISHAIRSLETRLGFELFERYGRAVVLTEPGRAFVSRLRLSLSLITEAFDRPGRAARPQIVVGAPAGVAERLLAPKLPAFMALNPGQRFELRLAGDHTSVTNGAVDVAVLFGAGACPGLVRRRLVGEALIPVARPGPDLPRRPEDLARAQLIHHPEHPWRLFLEEVGLSELQPPLGLVSDSAAAAVELARCGAGVCLARKRLVAQDLASGALVRLFEAEAALREDYCAVWNPASPRADLAEAFVDWLAGEFGEAAPPAGRRAA